MDVKIDVNRLIKLGLDQNTANHLSQECQKHINAAADSASLWQNISQTLLPNYSFPIHLYFFNLVFPEWHEHPESAPAWMPTTESIATANISECMRELNIKSLDEFHRFSVNPDQSFWQYMIRKLSIQFKSPPSAICDLSQGVEVPTWFPDASFNIVDSCFTADKDAFAIICQSPNKKMRRVTYQELERLVNRIANSLIHAGFQSGDAIAVMMPMHINAVAIYLAIIKMGGVVVSIADSFSTQEVATRMKITNTKAIFTQDVMQWAGKTIALYERVKHAHPATAIVLANEEPLSVALRDEDIDWQIFLLADDQFESAPCHSMQYANILFSSGTTGNPKAIPWTHTTPLKCASDAFFHQNIKANDVLAWPTNLGWMMGPWLIYAALINRATLALYPDVPKDRIFGEFIRDAKVTMLGVVPTLVTHYRESKCMEGIDWQSLKILSSTGECSNPEDMLYLMSLANYKPIIEYCGGTEIGGAYISSTVIENNYPSLFTTPTMGSDFTIIDEIGEELSVGEVAIIPPAVGLSTIILNANHHDLYFKEMPMTSQHVLLRRHGDHIKCLAKNRYLLLGRMDDTMNLGGIKVSAAELERTLMGIPNISETAAVAISARERGPSLLVIYAATKTSLNKVQVLTEMQKRINTTLNPLFKIYDVILQQDLPKTASNKIMRRMLRKDYQDKL